MPAFDDEDIESTLFKYREAMDAQSPSITAGLPVPVQPGVQLPGQGEPPPFSFMPPPIQPPGFDPTVVGNTVPSDPNAAPEGVGPRVPFGSPYAQGAYPDATSGAAPQSPFVNDTWNQQGEGSFDKASMPWGVPAQKGKPLDAAGQAKFNEDQAALGVAQGVSNAASAKLDAEASHIDRQASVLDSANQDAIKANLSYQQNRAQARQEADMETGRWMQKMEAMAAEEPNHQRYWQNQDGFGKSLWLLGMALSSAALIGEKGAGQKQNPVLQMLQEEITKDVQAQKARMANQKDAMKTKGDIMKRRQDDKMSDLRDDYSMYFQRLEGLKQAALLRANSPGPEDHKMAMMAGAQKLGELQMQIATHRSNEAYQSKEAALTRNFQAGQHAADRANALALKGMEIKAAAEKQEKKDDPFKDTYTIPQQLGVQAVDRDGRPMGGARVPKEFHKEATHDASNANSVYELKTRLAKELRAAGSWSVVVKNNPNIVSDFMQLGYRTSKEMDPRAVVTDRDLANGMEVAGGRDMSSWTSRIQSETMGVDSDDMADFLEKSAGRMKPEVSNRLTAYVNEGMPGYEGAKIVWSPKDLGVPKPTAETDHTRASKLGIDAGPVPVGELPYVGGDTAVEKASNLVGASPDIVREGGVNLYNEAKRAGDKKAMAEIQQTTIENYSKAVDVIKEAISTPANPKEVQDRAVTAGIRVTDDEAAKLSEISRRAGGAIEWWNQQHKNNPMRIIGVQEAADAEPQVPVTQPRFR